jgi:CO/xanthine dehydrogenase FAD-binding subunit
VLPAGTRTTFLKLGRRNALAISRISVAAAGRQTSDGHIEEVRLAVGACFPRPRRIPELEVALRGQYPSPDLFAYIGHEMVRYMLAETGRRWSTEYKSRALVAMVEEALWQVLPLPASKAMGEVSGSPEGVAGMGR